MTRTSHEAPDDEVRVGAFGEDRGQVGADHVDLVEPQRM
jgi:hypothetical protein